MSPSQAPYPSGAILALFPQRSPLEIGHNMFVACLLKRIRRPVSNTVTSVKDLAPLPGLFNDSKPPF